MAIETKPNTSERALARFQEIREIAEQFPSERFHLLLPTVMMEISPLFIPSPVPVSVDPRDSRQVYVKPGSSKDAADPEFCFSGEKLQEIANAGGLDFDPSLSRHRHDRKNEPYVCEQIAAGWYVDSLGVRRLISSDWVAHDLRDGSPRAKIAASPKQLEVARQFVCEQCGTRARSRAIRKTMKLHSSYRRSELIWLDEQNRAHPKPFVAIRFRLNDADPDVKKALIERGTGVAREVFGTEPTDIENAPRVGDELDDIIEGEARVVADAPEPEIPAASAPPDAGPKAPTREEVAAIAAAAVSAVAKRPEGERAQLVDDGLLTIVGTQLRDALSLEPQVQRTRWPIVRVAILRGLFGVTKSKAASVAQARVVIDMTKDPQGQAQLRRLFAWSLEKDPTLVEVAADLVRPEQQTLAAAGEVLR